MRNRRKWLAVVLGLAILATVCVLGRWWMEKSSETDALAKFGAIRMGMTQAKAQRAVMDGSYMWSTLQSSDIYNSRDGRFSIFVLYEPPPGKARTPNWADDRAGGDWVVREKRLLDLRRWPRGLEGPMTTLGFDHPYIYGREIKKPETSTITP